MKYIKIIMMLCVAALFTACSDDEEGWGNASKATVEFEQAEIVVKENKGIVYIPVKVTGENKGRVQVTVAVTAADENGAEEDVNYMITSKTIAIAAEDTIGNIEFITVDDEEINANREFIVTIASVKGATAVEGTQTKVVLRDNDAEFYDKLTGKWTMTVENANGSTTWDVNVIGFDEGEDGYNQTLYVTGMMNYSWTVAELAYNLDVDTKKVSVAFVFPYLFAEGVDFGLGGENDVILYGADESDNFVTDPLVGEVSEDFKTITFNEWPLVYGTIFSGADFTGHVWFGYHIVSMTR